MIASPIAAMVVEMIARGVDPDVIALAVSTAEQTLRDVTCPQKSADTSADKRREKDRIRKQNERANLRISAESAENPQMSKSASISKDSKKDSKRQNRGTRIADKWTANDDDRSFAKREGFSEFEINRETQKFLDYWTACAGPKGVKLDWSATWRQWIRSGAERAGKTPQPSTSDPASSARYYAKADSDQIVAWDAYTRRTTGRGLPRDKNGGWLVKAEWPPDDGILALKSKEAAE